VTLVSLCPTKPTNVPGTDATPTKRTNLTARPPPMPAAATCADINIANSNKSAGTGTGTATGGTVAVHWSAVALRARLCGAAPPLCLSAAAASGQCIRAAHGMASVRWRIALQRRRVFWLWQRGLHGR
jgi:hypothetical protein